VVRLTHCGATENKKESRAKGSGWIMGGDVDNKTPLGEGERGQDRWTGLQTRAHPNQVHI